MNRRTVFTAIILGAAVAGCARSTCPAPTPPAPVADADAPTRSTRATDRTHPPRRGHHHAGSKPSTRPARTAP